MGHQIIHRISRLFQSSAPSTTTTASPQQPSNTIKIEKSDYTNSTSKRKRWTTTFGRKKKGHHHHHHHATITEWFSSDHSKQQFNDEKVEIIVPSSSINSFLSTSTNSGYQHVPFYFSSPSLSPQKEVDEFTYTPRTSIDEQETEAAEKPVIKRSVGLASLVRNVLGDAITIADEEYFKNDDFN